METVVLNTNTSLDLRLISALARELNIDMFSISQEEQEDIENNVKTLNSYTMIKYYKGEAMGIYCRVMAEKLVFNTWFPIKDKRVRNGLLVKKK